MRDQEWRALDEGALERLLVERWLYRGALLGVVFLAAVLTTYLGLRGMGGLADQVTVAVLLALALGAGGAAFVMRQGDLRIHQELRQRRASGSLRARD
jgi:uncharacterized protein HemX